MFRCDQTSVVFVLVVMAALTATPLQAAGGRTFTLDAVELLKNGKEIEGERKHAVTRDGYTYYFTTAGNKSAFEAEPTRFEIQMGGACGRMGPLSGSGNCDYFAVSDGHLYIFASPQCRDSFLKTPNQFIETDDPPVKADAGARKRGMELLDMAVKAHGGASAIDGATNYRQTTESTETHGGGKYDIRYSMTIAFPDRIRDESCWNKSCSIHVSQGEKGGEFTEKGLDKPMAASQVRALKRKANANLLSILKARGRADFIAAPAAAAEPVDAKRERVQVSFDGGSYELVLDAKTGRVESICHTGRGGKRDQIGRVVRTFTDYEIAGGVSLPMSWTTAFDGGEPDDKPTKLTKVEVNVKLDEKAFAVEPSK